MNRTLMMRILLTALLLYALASFGAARSRLDRAEELCRALQTERDALAAETELLRERLEAGPSDEEMRRLAWERLGMLLPEEKVFCFVGPEAETG